MKTLNDLRVYGISPVELEKLYGGKDLPKSQVLSSEWKTERVREDASGDSEDGEDDVCTPCPKKTKQICFCQNFVKFPQISIILGRKMGNDPNICEVHSFSTSPNLRHHLTVLNANVPDCYITPKLLVIDRSHWRPQFIRGRRTFQDHSNFRQFVHIW